MNSYLVTFAHMSNESRIETRVDAKNSDHARLVASIRIDSMVKNIFEFTILHVTEA